MDLPAPQLQQQPQQHQQQQQQQGLLASDEEEREKAYAALENVTLMPYVEELLSLLRAQQNPAATAAATGAMSYDASQNPQLAEAVNEVLNKLAADMRRLADFANPRNTPGAQYASLEEQQAVIRDLQKKHEALDQCIDRYRAMLADILDAPR